MDDLYYELLGVITENKLTNKIIQKDEESIIFLRKLYEEQNGKLSDDDWKLLFSELNI